jgi:AraC family transcriptional regulator
MGDVVYIRQILYVREHIRIKNMVCDCCMTVIRNLLESHPVIVESLSLGKAVILIDPERFSLIELDQLLSSFGMGLIKSREAYIVDEIKLAVIDLVHRMNNVSSIVRKSDYLVGKTGMSYQTLSKIFSRHESITLEKYIILNKIERIKELIDQDEFTLSEMAYMMDYSSVAYLSAQFKKYTGYSVTEYKAGLGEKIPINRIS